MVYIDDVISYLEILITSFSTFFVNITLSLRDSLQPVLDTFEQGSPVREVLEFLFDNYPGLQGYSLIEILLGVGLLALVAWCLFKFFVDGIPLVGS